MYKRNIKHSRVKNLYKFASLKNRASLTLESSLEFDVCFHFEYSKSVSTYEAQPVGQYYLYGGKLLPYTPDFLTTSISGKHTYYEVKYAHEARDPEVQDRFRYKQRSFSELGFELKLITERQLRQGPKLKNLKLLHRYAGESKYSKQIEWLLSLLRRLGVVTMRQLLDESKLNQGELNKLVLIGASLGVLLFDLDIVPFGCDTEVSIVHG